MTNPTERPEERDSLSEFTEHLSSPDDEINAGYHHYVIRTLINEVKLRDATVDAIALALDLSKFASRDDIEDALASKLNEVKELREENARLRDDKAVGQAFLDELRASEATRKQMEEALRKIAEDEGAGTAMLTGKKWNHPRYIARAALSPSDTEEALPGPDDVRGIFEREPSDTEEEAVNADDIAAMGEKHRQMMLRRFLVADPDAAYICARCRTPWPCDSRRLFG